MDFLKKLTLEKFGIFSFLLFFILTPVLLKFKIIEGVYVEPFLPFLILGTGSLIWVRWKEFRNIWLAIKQVLFPNRLAAFYFVLMGVLFLSFIYGYFLTGIFSSGTFLRIIKYTFYFLPFPLAIYAGRYLGRTNTNRVLVLLVLVGVATAVVSLIRIFTFLKSGGVIDFWEYGIYNRSVGVLGQFFDPLNLTAGLTGKAAHGTYGLYATIILAICLVLVSRFKEFTARWFTFFGMATFLFYGAILYTLSRGAIVTAGLVFGGWFFWLLKEKKIKTVIFTILFLTLTSLLLIWVNPQVYDKFASTLTFLPERTGQDMGDAISKGWGDEWDVKLDASSRGRLERWGAIVAVLKEHPKFAIFGVGYSQDNLEKFTGVSLTHSLFLDLWARGGITSLILLIGIWILIFGAIIRFTLSRDSEVVTFGYVLGGFAIGWLLDNLISGEQFFSDAPMILFWGVLGLVTALSKLSISEGGKKKVLQVLTSSDIGGAPQVVSDLLENSKSSEFEFVVVAPRGPFIKRFKSLGCKVYTLPLNRVGLVGFRGFYRILKEEKIDLINSHGKGAGLYARVVGSLFGIPVINTIHGIHYSKTNPISRNFYFLSERILSGFTRLVINVSKNQEKEGFKLRLFPKSKSRVVVNGIEASKFGGKRLDNQNFRRRLGVSESDFTVVMAARFDPPGVKHKGQLRFINLIPSLIKSIPNLKIVFAGGGEGEVEAKKLARDLGVWNSVLFLGERQDVPMILKNVDGFVLPSYHEGLPISVLEASASGLPVIGSNVVGIKDAVKEGETGLLVDFNNPRQAIEAFRKLSKSPDLRKRMGERGQEFVKKEFSMDKFVDKTLKVYEEALAS